MSSSSSSSPYVSTTHLTDEPQWEMTESGWHAVVARCSRGKGWTAYLEYENAPHWRIWSGCLFETMGQARDWCSEEIIKQMHRSGSPQSLMCAWHLETAPWRWLWDRLSQELGYTRTEEVRREMLRRLQHQHQIQNGHQQPSPAPAPSPAPSHAREYGV
ncbi:MAG: hypothetical protein HC884_10990 [Chloroflexaceae bacterium]|nr:hypothetical protein [Chloroflexaceae bacterium]